MKTQTESPLHFTCDRPDLTLVRLAKTLRRDARRDRKPQLGQPEVQNLQSSLARNLQVAGLEVTMNYPVVIRCRQAFRKLHARRRTSFSGSGPPATFFLQATLSNNDKIRTEAVNWWRQVFM